MGARVPQAVRDVAGSLRGDRSAVREINLTAGLSVWFPDDPSEFQPTYEHPFYPGQTFDVIGPTPDDAIREIRRLAEVGVKHFQTAFENMTTLHRFIDDVLPSLT
jgi:hypothetical protein